MLELSHVQVLFGQKPVLQDLSFTLKAGQRLLHERENIGGRHGHAV